MFYSYASQRSLKIKLTSNIRQKRANSYRLTLLILNFYIYLTNKTEKYCNPKLFYWK